MSCLWGLVKRVIILVAGVVVFVAVIRWAWQGTHTAVKTPVCAHAETLCEPFPFP